MEGPRWRLCVKAAAVGVHAHDFIAMIGILLVVESTTSNWVLHRLTYQIATDSCRDEASQNSASHKESEVDEDIAEGSGGSTPSLRWHVRGQPR